MKNEDLVKMGDKIRGLRFSQGYSQEDFAQLIKLHRSYMGGVERGERNISCINLLKIARALNLKVGDLFND